MIKPDEPASPIQYFIGFTKFEQTAKDILVGLVSNSDIIRSHNVAPFQTDYDDMLAAKAVELTKALFRSIDNKTPSPNP